MNGPTPSAGRFGVALAALLLGVCAGVCAAAEHAQPDPSGAAEATAVSPETADDAAGQAAAKPAAGPVEIVLPTGERLTGTVKSLSDTELVLEHPVLGEIKVPRDKIASSSVPLEDAVPPPPPPPPSLPEPDFWHGWTGNVELGVNGSSGNTESFNLRAGLGLERKTKKMETKLTASYTYETSEGDNTTNQARLDVRNDWLTMSRWRYFAQGFVEYDEFQDWDLRVGAFGGVGYEFINNDRTLLLGRAGIGFSREIGGADNTIRPEGLLGLDFNHQISDTTKWTSSIDLYPDLSDIGAYRFTAKAGIETLLDATNNMYLKLGVEDRYDSTPNGAHRNDLDYFALIGWKF